LPFFSITLTYWIRPWWRTRIALIILGALLIFTFGRRFLEIDRPAPRPSFVEEYRSVLTSADAVYVVGPLPSQDKLLELYFLQPNLKYLSTENLARKCARNPEAIYIRLQSLPVPENNSCPIIFIR
jgi:hypothetical protein